MSPDPTSDTTPDTTPDSIPDQNLPSGSPIVRGMLWGFLLFAIVAIVAGTVVSRRSNVDLPAPEPLPSLAQLPPFELTNRDGSTVGLDDLAGEPFVTDFIFTRCAATCPVMSSRMVELADRLPEGVSVRRVSISVDPEYDTPEVLEEYAERFDAPDDWLFLTGAQDDIFRLARRGYLLGVDNAPDAGTAEEPIFHSTRFVLADSKGVVRGYYNALNIDEIDELAVDLLRLLDEEARR